MLGVNLVFLQLVKERESKAFILSLAAYNNISSGRKSFSLADILITEKNEISAIHEEKITISNRRMYLARIHRWSLTRQSRVVICSLSPCGEAWVPSMMDYTLKLWVRTQLSSSNTRQAICHSNKNTSPSTAQMNSQCQRSDRWHLPSERRQQDKLSSTFPFPGSWKLTAARTAQLPFDLSSG